MVALQVIDGSFEPLEGLGFLKSKSRKEAERDIPILKQKVADNARLIIALNQELAQLQRQAGAGLNGLGFFKSQARKQAESELPALREKVAQQETLIASLRQKIQQIKVLLQQRAQAQQSVQRSMVSGSGSAQASFIPAVGGNTKTMLLVGGGLAATVIIAMVVKKKKAKRKTKKS